MEKLLEVLKQGGIILYPTDTIWGLGCDAANPEAIQKLFSLKKREQGKSAIILVENEQRLQKIVEVPAMAWEIIDLSEKPVTIIYDNPKGLPKELLAEDGSIGIRLTKDDFCKKLISKLNSPIVSTSANFSGEKSPMSFSEISQELKNQVDAIVEERQDQRAEWEGSSVIRIWEDGRIKVIRE